MKNSIANAKMAIVLFSTGAIFKAILIEEKYQNAMSVVKKNFITSNGFTVVTSAVMTSAECVCTQNALLLLLIFLKSLSFIQIAK
jgi:hypothetical protein